MGSENGCNVRRKVQPIFLLSVAAVDLGGESGSWPIRKPKSRDSAQPQRTDLQTESLFLSLFVQTLVIGAIVF